MTLEPISQSNTEMASSPFSNTLAKVEMRGKRRSIIFISGVGLCIFLAIMLAGLLAMRYVADPYRTLPSFPTAKYLDDYKGLAGSRYKAQLRVEADLGWKDKGGRLMLFSTEDDPRPFAVLLPASVAQGAEFTKGQVYMVELEVKEGGLVYADLFRKD